MRKVTVVGAGSYGSTTVKKLADYDLVDEVVMTDIVEGLPQGLALDMNQARPVERYRTRVVGTNGYEETAGSEVVVITAGSPRKPGMSRMDLLEVNAGIVEQVTRQVVEHSPETVLIVVTNPLDHMTLLAAEVSGLPRSRVMGQAGVLDSARFAHFISQATGADILEVEALTLGSHGETMVPVPSQCRVNGRPLGEVLDEGRVAELVEHTRDAGAEIVGLLQKGSAYFAPAAAAAAMARAVLRDSKEVMPVCAWTSGEYGIGDLYLGVPARLGSKGVEEVVELSLTEDERAALTQAAEAVRDKVQELQSVQRG
ncbi:MAG: malate dehydrogenase [Actinomycetota bacterium]|nr:malate dehydrogenase [Actinomycetota bacterium]